MKKHGKIWAIAAAVVMCLTTAIGLAACGSGSASITNVYTTRGTYTEMPESPQQIKMTTSLTVSVFSDNTYVLNEVQYGFMGAYNNSQVGQFTSVIYGTFTQEAGAEEGQITVKLSKPTRIVYNAVVTGSGATLYDTDNASSFEDAEDVTAESLLGKGKEYTLTVDTATNTITAGIKAGDIIAALQAA